MARLPVVAIVGRPNVGKSTLFNRLVGRRLALVDDTPGVTRDRREGEARWGDLAFTAVDTAGLEEVFDDSLPARMRRQTERAVTGAGAALLLVDARSGLTPLDRSFARWLRRLGTPVILVANKCEGRAGTAGFLEAHELGLGDPVAISAEHGEGMSDLMEAIEPHLARPEDEAEPEPEPAADDDAEPAAGSPDRPILLAVVGRPNVGKSTLVNALLGEERMLVGPEPGVTRDAITVDWQHAGRAFRLVDTAGLRRRARVEERLEKMSAADTMSAIRLAHVVVLVVEGAAILDKQDLTIARQVAEEGRALLLAVNKWDLVSDHAAALARIRDRLETSLPQVRGLPAVTVSALKGVRLDKLMDAATALYDIWNTRIATGPLNRWLAGMTESHPPPLAKGRRVRLRYITQIKARPPTFALWTNQPQELPESYARYLVNGLRDAFGLAGVPIRLMLRKGDNPYAR
jgi:GTP-binding protein